MKKMGKKLLVGLTMALLMTSTAFAAGGWKKNETGWWYATNDAGTTWHANGWQWIDGNNDGTSECYYFDPNGYMLANCKTPDGYTVNADGAWVLDNQVQIKTFASAEYVATKNYNYNYSGSIINTVAPTLIAIRDQEGNLVGEVSRKQDYCHPHDGCMNSYDGIKIQLERGKKYDIDVVMSFYGKGSAINTAERKASMRVEANINGIYKRK